MIVYSHLFVGGEAKVLKSTRNNTVYTVHVKEKDSNIIYSFTEDGRINSKGGICLSLTKLEPIIN